MTRLRRQSRGFTLFEILAVITLITVVFAVATLTFTAGRSRLSNGAYQFTEDIQGLYAAAIKTGRIHRLMFTELKDGYTCDVFEMPNAKPKGDNREALEKWEEEQRAIEEANKDKRKDELTRLDRGIFRTIKKRTLNSSLKIKSFLTFKSVQQGEPSAQFLLFYPSGETDQALIVLEDSSDRFASLQIDPLSGRVKTVKGEVTVDQWKKEIGIK